jgi:large subunit ribosomal protein L9
MKIILNKDVINLGEEGDVKIVADGYARNFLIPQKMALPFTKGNVKNLEQKKNAIEQRKEEKQKGALSLKERLTEEAITLSMSVGEKGKLFGAVTPATIVEELAKNGINVDKRKVELPGQGIKVVGEYIVNIKLYGGKNAELKINVKPLEQEVVS